MAAKLSSHYTRLPFLRRFFRSYTQSTLAQPATAKFTTDRAQSTVEDGSNASTNTTDATRGNTSTALVRLDAPFAGIKHKTKLRWTDAEEKQFLDLLTQQRARFPAKARIIDIDWDWIARQMKTRKAEALIGKYKYKYHNIIQLGKKLTPKPYLPFLHVDRSGKIVYKKQPKIVRRRVMWTVEEDESLLTAVAIYHPGHWIDVSKYVGTRTSTQCAYRWKSLCIPQSVKRAPPHHWLRARAQNSLMNPMQGITAAASSNASTRSSLISAILSKQQRHSAEEKASDESKWDTKSGDWMAKAFDETLSSSRQLAAPFTPAEDVLLFRLLRIYGTRWMLITKLLNIYNGKADSTTAVKSAATVTQVRTEHQLRSRYMELAAQHEATHAEHAKTPPTDEDRCGALEASVADGDKKAGTKTTKVQKQPHPKERQPHKRWTAEEDARLSRVMKETLERKRGFISWNDIARQMEGTNRDRLQCRYRWLNYLNSDLKHTLFTLDEDKLLWPFVIDDNVEAGKTGPKATGHNTHITVNYDLGSEKLENVGMGWLTANLVPDRSSGKVRQRIWRLRNTISWLRTIACVPNPEEHIELVHRLANTPFNFPHRAERLKLEHQK
ncbi:hypothetical protein H4R20_000759 [Coemansia guatemalensis]|uniref:Uncharacterized protein n=1 Tax=Coemansia guatemalensis TaxID=2761395 RepID=A0A9W8I375_9FUNG|nr:hypothetical protein H4R20_000759 [Coemansia guatemalensis]